MLHDGSNLAIIKGQRLTRSFVQITSLAQMSVSQLPLLLTETLFVIETAH